jgi:hypothetical protein
MASISPLNNLGSGLRGPARSAQYQMLAKSRPQLYFLLNGLLQRLDSSVQATAGKYFNAPL